MKTSRNYIILFLATSFAGAFTLRFLALEFLYHKMGDFWSGIGSTVFATGTLGIIISYFIAKQIRKMERVSARIRDGGTVSDAERAEALGVYPTVNKITILTNVIAFFAGQFVVMTLDVKNGVVPYQFSCCVLIMMQSMLVGTIAAMYEIYSFNNMMAPHRKLLKLHSIAEFGQRSPMSISATLTLVTTVSLLFVGVNSFSAAYGLIVWPNTIGDAEPISAYLRFGAEAIVFSAIVCFGLIRIITSELRGRIADTSERLKSIGEKGDLASRIDLSMSDDLGILMSDFNGFVSQLGVLIGKMQKGTDEVFESADALTHSMNESVSALTDIQRTVRTIEAEETKQNELIQMANDEIRLVAKNAKDVEAQVSLQMAAVQQSSASVNEMAANVASVAEMTRKADELSTMLTKSSGIGSGAIGSAIAAIREIQETSKQVQEIVLLIDDIANRTNLLSMNAAIEAAHAGAAGRGFAIVANEVRSLALSSSKSAGDIQKQIKVMVEKIERGVGAISSAGSAFGDITTGIGQTADLMRTIAGAMEEQRAGAAETTKATAEVDDSIRVIQGLSRQQREYAVNMESAIGEIVSAAKQIADALKENGTRSENLDRAIRNMERSIGENARAVTDMKSGITIFRI
jgi:methyl-accepting chemotaxis protein